MAYYIKRGSKWQAQISWLDSITGKRKYKYKSGFKTKREAMVYAAKMEIKKSQSQLSDQDPTFYDYFCKWYQTYKENHIVRATKEMYLSLENHIYNYFGKQKLSKITSDQYQSFINELGQKRAKVTMQKFSSSLSACIESAVIDRIIPFNFTKRSELVFNKSKTREVDYLSLAEIHKLIHLTLSGIKPRAVSKYMIVTAIYTGMRIGEISALTWDDIDTKHRTIRVNKSMDAMTHIVKEPKTKYSNRTIRVNIELIDLLKQLDHGQDNVFGTSVPTNRACNKELQLIMKKGGISKTGFHFHSLRHAHVAMLLEQGIDLYAISKRLGHANIGTTSKVYAYLIDELKARSDDKIESILSGI